MTSMSGMNSHLCWALLQLQNYKAESATAVTAFSNMECKYLRLCQTLQKLWKLHVLKLEYIRKEKGKSGTLPLCHYLGTNSSSSWCIAFNIPSCMCMHTCLLLNGNITAQLLWDLFPVNNLSITSFATLMIYIDRKADRIETHLVFGNNLFLMIVWYSASWKLFNWIIITLGHMSSSPFFILINNAWNGIHL